MSDAIKELPPIGPNEIRVLVEGGLVRGYEKGINVSPEIDIAVCDFDTEGADPEFDDIYKYGDGEECTYSSAEI